MMMTLKSQAAGSLIEGFELVIWQWREIRCAGWQARFVAAFLLFFVCISSKNNEHLYLFLNSCFCRQKTFAARMKNIYIMCYQQPRFLTRDWMISVKKIVTAGKYIMYINDWSHK